MPDRKRTGVAANSANAAHPKPSATLGQNDWVDVLIPSRNSEAPPASRIGVNSRLAAGVARRQRSASTTKTAKIKRPASPSTRAVSVLVTASLSVTRKALLGQ